MSIKCVCKSILRDLPLCNMGETKRAIIKKLCEERIAEIEGKELNKQLNEVERLSEIGERAKQRE